MLTITPESLHDRMSQARVQLIDVRSPAEYARSHAKGARNVPLEQLSLAALGGIDVTLPIYLICKSGMRSHMGVRMLHSQGVNSAINVSGGTDGWRMAGLPVESTGASVLVG
ncbi:MAG: rhodanese-like domain-containing protein [Burkholderiales bacterium]